VLLLELGVAAKPMWGLFCPVASRNCSDGIWGAQPENWALGGTDLNQASSFVHV
jgi:hypothetical protein